MAMRYVTKNRGSIRVHAGSCFVINARVRGTALCFVVMEACGALGAGGTRLTTLVLGPEKRHGNGSLKNLQLHADVFVEM